MLWHSIFSENYNLTKPTIYLSLKHLDKEEIITRFNNIYQQLKIYGFDLTSDLIPVAPAAHYMVGGIRTNLDAETNISGLFVCGEAASTGSYGSQPTGKQFACSNVWFLGNVPATKLPKNRLQINRKI
jgi:L-aspartate oxidase